MHREKVKEAIHYISYLSGKSPEKFGKTKLHKILWFFEGIMYWYQGKKPINGVFIKDNYGPTLEGLDEILKELEGEKKIKVRKSINYFGNPQWLLKSITEPEIKYLSHKEKEILSLLTNRFLMLTAKQLSKKTHTICFERKKRFDKLNPLSVISCFKPEPEEINENDVIWAKDEIRAIRNKKIPPSILKLQEKINIIEKNKL